MLKQSASVRQLSLVIAVAAVVFVSACSSAKKKEEGGVPGAAEATENTSGDSDSGKAMGLETVRFPFDSFILDQEAKASLKNNASVLKDKSSLKVQIEGHCDQRGGIQYNIALGEKRANATRKFLVDLGIQNDRMTVISFGKEKLLDSGTSEEAYAKNRRSNFVITSH